MKVHNSMLDGLRDDMLSAEGLLGGSVNRLKKVMTAVLLIAHCYPYYHSLLSLVAH